MSEEEEWEARLAGEGLRPEPPVKRLRVKAKDRHPGRDPQPRKEVSYDAWEQTDRQWGYLTSSPQTQIEAMMTGEDDSKEEQEARFAGLLEEIADLHDGALLILNHMTGGSTEADVCGESGMTRTEVREIKKAIRTLLAKRYGLDPEEDL